MSRPALNDMDTGVNAWNGIANDNFAKLANAPLPFKEYADFASLPAAGSYDRCVAVTISPPKAWISNGSAWLPLGLDVAVHQTAALSGASVTWTAAFPAGVRRVGVAGRVTTAVTGATGTNVGDHAAADPDRYAANVAVALGTTFKDAATADPGGWSSTAQDVVLTAVGPNFSGGVFRLYAFYIATFAPVS